MILVDFFLFFVKLDAEKRSEVIKTLKIIDDTFVKHEKNGGK
jgi:hypothetical protein